MLDLQHSSRFRTIERQDSFDLSGEPVIRCGRGGSVRVVRPQPRTQSLDLSNLVLETNLPPSMERNSHLAFSTPGDIFRSCASTAQTCVDSPFEPKTDDDETLKLTNGSRSPSFKEGRAAGENIRVLVEPTGVTVDPGVENSGASAAEPKSSFSVLEASSEKKQEAPLEPSDQGSSGSGPVSEGDSGIDPNVEGGEEDGGGPAGAEESTAAERRGSDPSPRAKAQGKRKGEVFSLSLIVYLCVVLYFCVLNLFSWMLFCCQGNAITISDQQIFTWMI